MEGDRSNGVGLPQRIDLPLFVYGALKRGEPAHSWIGQHCRNVIEGLLDSHHLVLRDGFPLLVSNDDSDEPVQGEILYVDPDGYAKVGHFESSHSYLWATRHVSAPSMRGQLVECNTLLGRRPDKGADGNPTSWWSGQGDPLFMHGPRALAALAQEALDRADATASHTRDSYDFWPGYVRVQAAYLLLWSIVERFAVLRFGTVMGPSQRIAMMDGAYRHMTRDQPRVAVRRADRPDELLKSSAKPFATWYQVRSNQVHQGKSAVRDVKLVATALVGLHETFRRIIEDQWPRLGQKPAADHVSLQLPPSLTFTTHDYPKADPREWPTSAGSA